MCTTNFELQWKNASSASLRKYIHTWQTTDKPEWDVMRERIRKIYQKIIKMSESNEFNDDIELNDPFDEWHASQPSQMMIFFSLPLFNLNKLHL